MSYINKVLVVQRKITTANMVLRSFVDVLINVKKFTNPSVALHALVLFFFGGGGGGGLTIYFLCNFFFQINNETAYG